MNAGLQQKNMRMRDKACAMRKASLELMHKNSISQQRIRELFEKHCLLLNKWRLGYSPTVLSPQPVPRICEFMPIDQGDERFLSETFAQDITSSGLSSGKCDSFQTVKTRNKRRAAPSY